MSLKEKIEPVLTKLDELEDKIDGFNERLTTLENTYDDVKIKASIKADSAALDNLREKVRQFELFQIELKKKNVLMQETYSKHLNVLTHSVQTNMNNYWKTRDVTMKKFENFSKNPDEIEIADAYGLP